MATPDKILITACLLLRGDGGDGFFFACFSLKAAPRHQGIGPDHNRRGGFRLAVVASFHFTARAGGTAGRFTALN